MEGESTLEFVDGTSSLGSGSGEAAPMLDGAVAAGGSHSASSQSQLSGAPGRDLEALSVVTSRREEAAVRALLQKRIWRRSLVDLSW